MKFLKTIALLLALAAISFHMDLTIKLLIDAFETETASLIFTIAVWLVSMALAAGLCIWAIGDIFDKRKASRDSTMIKALRTNTSESQKTVDVSLELIRRLNLFDQKFEIYPDGTVSIKGAVIRDNPVELSTPGCSKPLARHSDDEAVDMFAAAMKAKLALKREQGASGWEIAEPEMLEFRLAEQANKENVDPIDVANYAAFLWNRN